MHWISQGMAPSYDDDADTLEPCQKYKSTSTVQPRWPPRATAALSAFLNVSRYAYNIQQYDGSSASYNFS